MIGIIDYDKDIGGACQGSFSTLEDAIKQGLLTKDSGVKSIVLSGADCQYVLDLIKQNLPKPCVKWHPSVDAVSDLDYFDTSDRSVMHAALVRQYIDGRSRVMVLRPVDDTWVPGEADSMLYVPRS